MTDAAEEAEVTESTASQVYQWFREVCSTKLVNIPIILGGRNVTVQIDESLFCHKPKYHREVVLQAVNSGYLDWKIPPLVHH